MTNPDLNTMAAEAQGWTIEQDDVYFPANQNPQAFPIIEQGEVDHDYRIRCPFCQGQWNPFDHEDYSLFEDGDHTTTCPECGKSFDVVTNVSFSFTSPPLDATPTD